MNADTCEECHALVPVEVMALHEDWHQVISSALMHLARRPSSEDPS